MSRMFYRKLRDGDNVRLLNRRASVGSQGVWSGKKGDSYESHEFMTQIKTGPSKWAELVAIAIATKEPKNRADEYPEIFGSVPEGFHKDPQVALGLKSAPGPKPKGNGKA